MEEGEREDNKEKVSEQNEGEQKEEGRKNKEHVVLVKDYGSMVESELSDVCAGILKLLDSHLIPSASANESKVFYLKMTSNYHRYMAEFKVGTQRKEAAEDTMLSYKAAQDICLAPTHPIRLGLELNFSVFYHEIQNATEKACSMAKQAVEEAIAELAFRCLAFHRDMRLSSVHARSGRRARTDMAERVGSNGGEHMHGFVSGINLFIKLAFDKQLVGSCSSVS